MKNTMIDIMVLMMPAMKPFMWFSVAVAVLGFVFVISNIAFKHKNKKMILWSGKIVLIASGFFMAAQLAGYFLSMPPTINFGDSSKFEIILVSFWQVGLVFLIIGFILKTVGGLNEPAKSH